MKMPQGPFTIRCTGSYPKKDYFVLTTNVDHCFQKAGFDKKRLFTHRAITVCSSAASRVTGRPMITGPYPAHGGRTKNMRIPTALIPRCPKCGKPMAVNLRSDDRFAEDEGWRKAAGRYADFLHRHDGMHILLWEIGVGYKTRASSTSFLADDRAKSKRSICLLEQRAGCLPQGDPTAVHLHRRRRGHTAAGASRRRSPMNELESLSQLNKMLLAESPQYLAQAAAFPPDAGSAVAAVPLARQCRAPRPAGGDFLALQDSLLQKITACKGVTAFHSLTPMQKGLYLWRGDITTLQTDGIVNAANSGLTGCYHPCHQCIDNAIHTFSGVQLRLACASIIKSAGPPGACRTGENNKGLQPALPLCPAYGRAGCGGAPSQKDRDLLASCYRSCLALAEKHGLRSIAFCCISTGEFHFPPPGSSGNRSQNRKRIFKCLPGLLVVLMFLRRKTTRSTMICSGRSSTGESSSAKSRGHLKSGLCFLP